MEEEQIKREKKNGIAFLLHRNTNILPDTYRKNFPIIFKVKNEEISSQTFFLSNKHIYINMSPRPQTHTHTHAHTHTHTHTHTHVHTHHPPKLHSFAGRQCGSLLFSVTSIINWYMSKSNAFLGRSENLLNHQNVFHYPIIKSIWH
jgi:hypothetical protein